MKKLLSLLLLLPLLLLSACHAEKKEDTLPADAVVILAEIVKIEEKIEVNVTESPVSEGPCLVIVNDTTDRKSVV